MDVQNADVIVVGAGLAGLSCAIHLQNAGMSVLVLEASDSVGGRVRTDVVDGFKDENSRSRLDGTEAVSITVKKRVGENIIAITDQIEKLIESRRSKWPEGVRITKLMDQAKDIRLMVADLENNILFEAKDPAPTKAPSLCCGSCGG